MENHLMNFRLGYLRTIAKAWSNTTYEDRLLDGDDIYNKTKRTICETLNPSKREGLNIRIGPDLLDKNGPFKKYFQGVRLGNVSIRVFDIEEKQTRWDPEDALGWKGNNDFFIIHLPTKPHKQSSKEKAIRLAEYYHKFPTFLGVSDNVESSKRYDPCNDNSGGKLGQGVQTDLGVSPGPFLEFGGVILRALALAWQREGFFEEITKETMIDATPVLSKYFSYNNPWNFNIRFIESDAITLSNDKSDDSDNSINIKTWENPPQNIILLHYPRDPNIETDHYPVALASYNETGPEYPFTCS